MMRIKLLPVFLIAITLLPLLVLFSLRASALGEDSPTVTAFRGTAYVYKSGGMGYTAVYRGMTLSDGDMIITELNSTVTISYYRKEVVCGELTAISINSIWNRHGRDDSSISLIEGMIKNRVDVELNNNSRNEIRAANTIAGVRGTEYVLIYSRMGMLDGGEENPYTRMKVIDGEVRFDLAVTGDDGEAVGTRSFLISSGGVRILDEEINGTQNITELDMGVTPDNFAVTLEQLDTEILKEILRSPKAVEVNPDLLNMISEILGERETSDENGKTAPPKPEPEFIFASEADEVLPTLPVPEVRDVPAGDDERDIRINPPPVTNTPEPPAEEPPVTTAPEIPAAPPPVNSATETPTTPPPVTTAPETPTTPPPVTTAPEPPAAPPPAANTPEPPTPPPPTIPEVPNTKADQTGFEITEPGTLTFGDSPVQLTVSGGNGSGTVAWSVTGTAAAIDSTGELTITGAGTVTVTAVKAGDGNYNDASASLEITIGKRDVSNITVTLPANAVYNGAAHTITVADGTLLNEVADIVISYAPDNTGAGTVNYTITATSSGNYTGEKIGSFEIKKATPEHTVPGNLSATYGDALSKVTLPDGWTWATPSDFVGNAGSNPHTATFTPVDTANYNTVSAELNITVGKATPAYAVPEDLTATYGDVLSTVTLTGGWAWDNPDASVGNAGTNSHSATFTPSDTANYNTVSAELSIIVGKANPVYTAPIGLTATYGDQLSTVTLTAGWAWDEPTDLVGNVGSNPHTATFTPGDTDNYNTVENIEVTITVEKADPAYIAPTGLTATYGDILSTVTLTGGWAWNDSTAPVGNVGTNSHSATFTPIDTDNYNTVSMSLSVEVGKATPEHTIPTGLAAIYGDQLSTVTLTGGWAWDDSTVLVGDVGEQTHKATFASSDTENYHTVSAELSITIAKATPAYTAPTDLTAIYGQTLSDVDLPAGWAWDTPGVSVGNAGVQTHKATFTPSDTVNYNTVSMSLSVDVGKATPDYTAPTGLTATYGETLSDVDLPAGWAWDTPSDFVGNAGERTHTATFTPDDTVNYEIVENIDVNITVSAKAISSATITIESPITYTGSAQTPDYTVTDNGIELTEEDYIAEFTDNTNAGDATLTITGIVNYTGTVTETFTIGKATPTYIVPTDLAATYGDVLSDVTLPTGWAWETPTDFVGNAGERTHTVTFTPDDTDNYNIVEDIDVTVTVEKANPEYTLPGNLSATYGDVLSTITLPAGWAWEIPTDFVGNVGERSHGATFTPDDTDNFKIVENIEVIVTVSPKAFSSDTTVIAITGTYTYTGTAQAPVYTVMDNGTKLTLGTEFTATFEDNVDAGDATLTVTGKGNYTGEVTETFTIAPKELTGATITIESPITYTGSAQTPDYIVTDNGIKLTLGTDFTADFADNIDAGDATLTITGIGNYGGEVTKNFTVEKANPVYTVPTGLTAVYGQTLSEVTLTDGWTWDTPTAPVGNAGVQTHTATFTPSDTDNYNIAEDIDVTVTVSAKAFSSDTTVITVTSTHTYTGSAQLPVYTVTDGSTVLTLGTDFTAGFVDNVDAGTATITITGEGNYTGTATETFTIDPKSLTDATITIEGTHTYTGSVLEPACIVTDDGIELTKEDYTAEFVDNVDAGTATITITGKGNYTGTATKTFSIAPKELTGVTISIEGHITYTGFALEPEHTVTDGSTMLISGTDYTFGFADNTNAGDATLTITGKGNYTDTVTKTFTIAPKSLTGATITIESPITYTGSAQTPDYTVTDNGIKLTLGTDFTADFADNIDAGDATLTITGIGNYGGEVTKNFTVEKATPVYTVPTGLAAIYGDQLSTVTLPAGWTWEITTAPVGNAGGQTHKATFTPVDTDNYNTVSMSLSVEVGKATPEHTIPTGLTAIYGDVLNAVELPGGWAWDDSTVLVGDVGEQTHNATFAPVDTDNYNIVEDIDVTVTVEKANPVYTIPTGLTATYGQTLSDVELPAGWEWEEPDEFVGNVGSNPYTATFTPADTANYNTASTELGIIVGKANPVYTVPTGLTATYGQKLSDVTLPTGWEWETPTDFVGNAGERTHKATFTPVDTVNYEIVENIDVNIMVSAKAISSGTTVITVTSTHTYTGSAQLPIYTVTDGSTLLIPEIDYTFGFANNTNAGTATLTITGQGNYTGTVTETFTIGKANQASLSINDPGSLAAGGGPVQLTTTGGSGSGAVTWLVTGGTGSATITPSGVITATVAGTITVTANKAGNDNYNMSNTATRTLTISSFRGSGTTGDPYRVGTEAQLRAVGHGTAGTYAAWGLDDHYIMTADITLTGGNWVIVGDNNNKLTGSFDGAGRSISGLKIVSDTDWGHVGMFNSIGTGGTVKNLSLLSVSITGGASHMGGIAGVNDGTVDRCYVSGTISGGEWVGGIVGWNNNKVTNSHNASTVNGTNDIGGVVGRNGYFVAGGPGTGSSVENCVNTGNVSGTANVGGITGYNEGEGAVSSSGSRVADCVSVGSKVEGDNGHGKRIAGNGGIGSQVANSYASASTLVNGSPITDGAADNVHGENITTGNRAAVQVLIANVPNPPNLNSYAITGSMAGLFAFGFDFEEIDESCCDEDCCDEDCCDEDCCDEDCCGHEAIDDDTELPPEDTDPPEEEDTDPPEEEDTDPPEEDDTDPPEEDDTDPPVEDDTDPPEEENSDPPEDDEIILPPVDIAMPPKEETDIINGEEI